MSPGLTNLFQPLQIGPTEIPNRLLFSAHSTHFAQEYLPTQRQADYYAERARGGAGWIVIGASLSHESSLWEQGFNLVSDERAIPGYQAITSAVHEYGTKISTQIGHFGPGVPRDRPFTWPVYAPSALPTGPHGEMAKEVDEDDMAMLIDSSVKSVDIAMRSGFDGVELLWSFDTALEWCFMTPRFNQRTDEYGGSLENRMRFPVRMLTAVREALGGRGHLGIKIPGDEMSEGGLDQDDIKEICTRLDALGLVDYFHITTGTRVNVYHLMNPEMIWPAGFAAYLAAGVREVVNVPVVAAMRIDDPTLADRLIGDGHGDVVAMARPLIADPELPNKAREDRLDDIRQCTSSNQECVAHSEAHVKLPIRCLQNPAVGEEAKFGIGTTKRSGTPRSVTVLGGGPAGMRAAKVAAQRGHRVRLYERADRLGGQILSILEVSTRANYVGIIRYLSRELDRYDVDVRLGEEATAAAVVAEQPDVVIVATGASGLKTGYSAQLPTVERMPGTDQEHVFSVFDVFAQPDRLGDRVVVVDEFGEIEAMITTEYLGQIGKQVTYVTRHTHAGAQVEGQSLHDYNDRLREYGVTVQPMTAVTAIDGKVVRGDSAIHLATTEWSQEADSVVLLMGKQANDGLYHELHGSVPELHRVGDCLAPRQITDAIWEGNLAGRAV
jgi:2,4-dienoyl-CoA reductase-like NADH-dependent reductase (Old Yellow Enzyme family)/thioredoxin reductase